MSRNLGTIFHPPAPNMNNNIDNNTILMTKLELQGMNNYICGFYRRVNSGESLTNLRWSPWGFTQFVSDLPQFIVQFFPFDREEQPLN